MAQFGYLTLLVCGLILTNELSEARQANCRVRKLKNVGSDSNGHYSDSLLWQYGKITLMHFCTDARDKTLVAFRFTYGEVTSQWHGLGDNKNCVWLPLFKKELIKSTTLYVRGTRIVSLTFKTNQRTLGPFGAEVGTKHVVNGRGKYLAFVQGYAGDFVNSIEFWHYTEEK